MRLSDCEVSHRVVRGTIVVFLFGERGLTHDERVDLLKQYVDAHGPGVVPAYASPDGWQPLDDPAPGPLASRFVFDEAQVLVHVDGKAIAGAMFDALTEPTADGRWLRIVSTDGGGVTVQESTADEIAAQQGKSAAPAAAKNKGG